MKLNEMELKNINGGGFITSTFISSIARAIDSIADLGRSFGTAIRRITSKKICSL